MPTLEFFALTLSAVLTSALAKPRPTSKDWATMRPTFIVDFISLLLLGPHVTMIVAAVGGVTEGLTAPARKFPIGRTLSNTAIVMIAIQAAGAAYQALGGTMGHFVWPMQGLPIAAAVAAYCFVRSLSAEIVVPLVTRQSIDRSWPKNFLRGCPTYFIGASIAVALAEVVDRAAWEILPVAALPLYFVYRAYVDHASRADEAQRRHE